MWKWLNVFNLRKGYVAGPRRGIGHAAGAFVSEDTAMNVSAFYRGVIYISTQIAKLPWECKDKDNKVLEDDIAILLDLCPNNEMSAFHFRLCMVQNAIIHGNAYAEIERNTLGRPIGLWPIKSRDVTLLRTPSGQLVYQVTGDSTLSNNTEYIEPKNMFHVKNFHTKNGLIGEGVVAYGMSTLGISISADRMAGSLFANAGLPSGVLSTEGRLSDEAYERLKQSWDEQHGNRKGKSGGVAILEEGVKWAALNMDPQVLQFLESRKFGVIEIARFLGLPPTKLFDNEKSTYNNQENSNLEVATDTLDAWARNLEVEADIKILNKRYGGRYTELDLYAVFRGDMTTRANYFSKMMQAGATTPNEIRRREGLAGYPGGDRYYIAVNNFTPADRIDEVVDAQIKSKEPAPPAKKEGEDEPEKDLARAAVRYLTK